MRNLTCILALFFVGLSSAWAQKETNIWYFGQEAGLDFNKTPVQAITNSKMFAKGGSSSICNSKGRLLFYSDGYTIYDSTHGIMPNGRNIQFNNNWTASQSALILPMPGNAHVYYLFTNNITKDTILNYVRYFLCYSVIDMRLNGGRGDIVKDKRNIVLLTQTTQMLAATKHGNDRDYWILTHKTFYDKSEESVNHQCDSIYSWLLSPQGLTSQAVISKTGRKNYLYNFNDNFLKVSPDGKKIAYINFSLLSKLGIPSDSVQIGDYDINTGKVGKLIALNLGVSGNHGLEFSPNGRYIYLTNTNKRALFQFNAQAKSNKELLASKILIDSVTTIGKSFLQLGPDGIIYSTVPDNNDTASLNYLNAILSPDSAGKKCNFKKGYLYLGGKHAGILPNFVSSYLKKVPLYIQSSASCLGDTAFFSIPYMNDPDSVTWDFGDIGSGNANFSKNSEVYHLYKNHGNYTVSAIVYDENRSDTLKLEIRIKTAKADFEAKDACEMDTVVFTNTSGFLGDRNYTWKFGDGTTDKIKNPKHYYKINGVSQTYNVTLVSSIGDGCKDSITKAVTVNANPISDFTFTASGKDYNFEATQFGNTKYLWLFGDGDSSAMAKPSHTYTDLLTMHTVCLKVTNVANCVSESCKQINTAAISAAKPSGFTLYPNPNTGSFTIELTTPEKDAAIEVYDLLGKLVKKVERVGKVTLIDLDVESGIYFVKVKNGDVNWNQKVFVSFGTDTNR